MKLFFDFRKKMVGGVWEIMSQMPYEFISQVPFNPNYINLLDLTFNISHGKKQRDIIYYYGDISIEFLSNNIYLILNQFLDVTPFLYPISIEGINDKYYFIHNLPEYYFINRNAYIPNTNYECEAPCFIIKNDMPLLFTLNDTRRIIITPEIKTAMQKAKLTNIVFEPIYGVSSMDEYYELQKNDLLRCKK